MQIPGQAPRPAPDELKKWNVIIGMREEPGEDPGARALRELEESQGGEAAVDEKILRAVQQYFSFRKGNVHGAHAQAAAEIADMAGGIDPDLIPIDLIETVGDEMEILDRRISEVIEILVKRDPSLLRSSRRLATRAIAQMTDDGTMQQFGHIDEDVVNEMAERIALVYAH